MLDEIRLQLNQLSCAARKVAQLAIESPYLFIHSPVADIARMAEVSQPTVIRFARAMHCRGLPDLKARLGASIQAGVPFVHSWVQPGDPVNEVISKLFDATSQSLMSCQKAMDANIVEMAANLLVNAREIEFYGLGNSGIIAADAQIKFFQCGIPTVSYSDSQTQIMSASLRRPGDVVVAISRSGRSLELIESIRVALDSGASVIAITARESPLARIATLTLGLDPPENDSLSLALASRLLQLILIDVLFVSVALRSGPDVISRLSKASLGLQSKQCAY
jgi:RpiR family carbohydrate utilization transcriptional regulator